MARKYKILFISHNAGRTGAPIALLYIIRYLKSKLDIDCTILLKADGPLREEFEKEGKVILFPSLPFPAPAFVRVINKIFKVFLVKQKQLIKRLEKENFDIVYGNTGAVGDLILNFPNDWKVVLHVHELNLMIKLFCGENTFISAIKRADRLFAVSGLVEKMLLNQYGISRDKVIKVYEPVESDLNHPLKNKPVDSFTVVGCGTIDWRKGVDLFLQTIKYVVTQPNTEQIKFVWVGGNLKSGDALILKNDIRMANLQERVSFTGEISNTRAVFEESHVFLLTSREDPFPLVCLENAQVGNPIICFKQATGISEIINDANGYAADFLDISAIGNEIIRLSNDEIYYKEKSASIRTIASNYTPALVCQPILKELISLTHQDKC